MKTIPLKKAFEILNCADAIIINKAGYNLANITDRNIDNTALVYPIFSDLTGEDENEFLYISWKDEGLNYCVKFCEGMNKTVKVSDGSLFLYDTDSDNEYDDFQITILTIKYLK